MPTEDRKMLRRYLRQISETTSPGDAREESYYSILRELLLGYAAESGKKAIHITTLPKKTEAGNPDFRVWDGKQHIVGYIEAKAPTTENLDAVEHSEQLKRYRHTFPNLILTNFFEFRLYRDGARIDRVLTARPFIAHTLKTVPPVEKNKEFLNLLDRFFAFSLPTVYDAKALAVELAKRTRFLKDEVVALELRSEANGRKSFIHGFYEAFRRYLIAGLSEEEFADLYSQTITYGLFAARTRAGTGFNRKLAFDHIPRTIGILRDVFRFISLEDLPEAMEWMIDDISDVLAVTDVQKILRSYFHEGKGKDPVVHFYETFLAEYDPGTREKRGVYYTPEPVVSYIVRSLHQFLKDHFSRPDGLASASVTALDPAAGTLTFPAEAARLAVREFVAKYGEGGKDAFIREHVLENFYAFELMMSPYAVGHLKMSFLLEELGYRLRKDDRFKLYLTNTLDMEDLVQTSLPGMSSLSEESRLAGKVKKEQPILVILGNPPYSGHSANKGKWIDDLLKKGYTHSDGVVDEGYYRVDSRPLGEKNPKWLQDDYVKFIRFAQWKIDQNGEGVLGFVTNHSYLDNPTFRGMRRSLMKSFDEIYVLDLHGNSLKKEICPDGSRDQNVFDIRQGVAIALFIKKGGPAGACRIFHSDLWGLRDPKYSWLQANDVKSTRWDELSPISESYLFVPRDEKRFFSYRKFPGITDVFPVNSVGIVTARDKLTIHLTPEKTWSTVMTFSQMEEELARDGYQLDKDVRDWKVGLAQKDLLESGPDRKNVVPILYRPFDTRYTYYTGRSRGFHCRPRAEVMSNLMQENLALILPKRVETKIPWGHVLCTDRIVEHVAVSLKTIDYVFPLFIYRQSGNPGSKKRGSRNLLLLFEPEAVYQTRTPNLSPRLVKQLGRRLKKNPEPEEIFFYVYAVLYCNIYRSRYAEFLRTDFPRVPFTGRNALFERMAGLGKRLVELHLLKSPELDPPIARFQGRAGSRVEGPRYDSRKGRVLINQDVYFEGISTEIWEYRIGGYQVCQKWLKDRKGGHLSLDEIRTYCRIVTALQKTVEVRKDIDAVYPEIERDVIDFELALTGG